MRPVHLPFIVFLFLIACSNSTAAPPPFAPSNVPAVSPAPAAQNNTPTIYPFDTPPPAPIAPPIDLLITVQKFESISDGYILYGSYQWASATDMNVVFLDDVIIQDANGNKIQYERANPAGIIPAEDKNLPFAFKILGKDHAFPLVISVQSITVILPDTASFQFDAGADPQVGDEWMTNIDVPINAYHILVHKIKLISGSTPAELGFNFTIWVGPNINIVNLSVTDVDATSPVYGGGGGEFIPGEIDYGWLFDGYVPAGLKTFQISNLTIKINGVWQTTWQP